LRENKHTTDRARLQGPDHSHVLLTEHDWFDTWAPNVERARKWRDACGDAMDKVEAAGADREIIDSYLLDYNAAAKWCADRELEPLRAVPPSGGDTNLYDDAFYSYCIKNRALKKLDEAAFAMLSVTGEPTVCTWRQWVNAEVEVWALKRKYEIILDRWPDSWPCDKHGQPKIIEGCTRPDADAPKRRRHSRRSRQRALAEQNATPFHM